MTLDNIAERRFLVPALLVLLAFVFRLYAAMVPGIIVPDGVVYIESAKMVTSGQWQKIADTGIYSLYPFLIALFHAILTDWETAGRMVSVSFGSLAVLPFYLLLKRMFDLRIALVASVFFVVSPRLVEYSSNVIREPVFWCFCLAALWSAWEGIVRRRWVLIVITSFCVGLSSATRMEGIALIPIVVFWIAWYYLRQKANGLRDLSLCVLIFLVSFPILFAVPLYVFKSRVGKWELGHIGSKIPKMLSTAGGGTSEDFRRSIDDSDVVSKVLAGNKYLYFLWQSVFKFLRSYHVLLIFLFLVGITRRKVIPRDADKEMPILIWSLVFLLVSILYVSKTFYLSTRHGMLISIPALVWVSVGFLELSDIVRRGLSKFGSRECQFGRVTAWCLILTCIIMLPKTLSWSGYDKIEMKKAGMYLRDHGFVQGRLAVDQRLVRLAFYADADYVVVPYNRDERFLENVLFASDTRLLVVDERSIDASLRAVLDGFLRKSIRRIEIEEFKTYREYTFTVFDISRGHEPSPTN